MRRPDVMRRDGAPPRQPFPTPCCTRPQTRVSGPISPIGSRWRRTLRFDFIHPKPVSADELLEIENAGQRGIRQNSDVATRPDAPTAQAIRRPRGAPSSARSMETKCAFSPWRGRALASPSVDCAWHARTAPGRICLFRSSRRVRLPPARLQSNHDNEGRDATCASSRLRARRPRPSRRPQQSGPRAVGAAR